MPEEREGEFKVTDRRLFNSDGTLRDSLVDQPVSSVVSELQSPMQPSKKDANSAGDYLGASPEMTEFMGIIVEFAAPAFIHLGMAEHPVTGQSQVNLPAAQQSIEMLRILREKTKGNLTREEEEFFDGLLSDIQMQFISLQ